MAEQIKELIEKIRQEGIDAAEEKAKEIRKEAAQKAAETVDKAAVEAHRIIFSAKEEAGKLEKNTKALLAQAARDMVLSLKKEIVSMLEAIIARELKDALTTDELEKIIATLIKENSGQEKGEVVVSLKKEDCEKLEQGFMEKLKGELKKSIVLRPAQEIQAGFTISFDAGKSHFDFTDKALAEYIGLYLKPALQEVLGNATP